MAQRKKKQEGGGGAPEWMCTFSDMMSLLLCFFVLLFSLSTIEKVKFEQAIGSIQGALGRIPMFFNTSYIKPNTIQPQKAEPLQNTKILERAKEAIAKQIRNKLVAEERSTEVVVEGVEEGIRFTVTGRALFEPGMARVTDEGKDTLLQIAEILNDFEELHVRIEGHTDSSPVPSNSIFPNNWRLAEARAYATLAYMRDQGNVREARMSFLSSGPYRPRFKNDTLENRALNRRVEIILLQGNQSEYITGRLQQLEEMQLLPDMQDLVPRQ
ncbi:OmpA family protein [bacterium]|nr:OmpA family protein [bacterium]